MKILLTVSGSIACYKSMDLLRVLTKQGHQVRVVLTSGALKFLRPELFRYLGAEAVYLPHDDFRPSKLSDDETVLHISLARWMDRMVIAPATASVISRLAQGRAEDLSSSIFLSCTDRPIIIYPAMNTQMWQHPLTQKNVNALKELPWVGIYPPVAGELACGETGAGKFPEVQAVADTCWCWQPTAKRSERPAKKILITTGATAALLDPVRFLTNSSTGETGRVLAQHFLSQGHHVTVVAGKTATPRLNSLLPIPGYQLHRASTTSEVKTLVDKLWPAHDIYLSAAALSDFEFNTSTEKINKSDFTQGLSITSAPDVLEGILKARKPGQVVVGFAAQSPLNTEVLLKKYGRKPVDLLVGNSVDHGLGRADAKGFGTEGGEYLILKKEKTVFSGKLLKSELATLISKELGLQ